MAPPIAHGSPGLLHLAVGDADRAVAFFGNLFGWGGERSVADTVSWYPLNTTVTVRLIADGAGRLFPSAPPTWSPARSR